MDTLARALLLFSSACLGVYAGAMLTEGFVLVPWWQSLPPAEFLAWYAANDELLLAYFSPVTSITAVSALLAAIVCWRASHPGRLLAALACALTLVAVAMFFVYFEAANASFSNGTITAEALPAELARWGTLHHVRTVLALLALAASLVALRKDGVRS